MLDKTPLDLQASSQMLFVKNMAIVVVVHCNLFPKHLILLAIPCD
jgi:hypothetical protein